MPRHGLKYCLICNPYYNGMRGEEGTEAIGRYYLMPGKNQATSGWMPVCEFCAGEFEAYFDIEPLKGCEDHPYFVKKRESIEAERRMHTGPYKHDWDKDNLVGQEDGTDWYKCSKCKLRAKKRMTVPLREDGCTVE